MGVPARSSTRCARRARVAGCSTPSWPRRWARGSPGRRGARRRRSGRPRAAAGGRATGARTCPTRGWSSGAADGDGRPTAARPTAALTCATAGSPPSRAPGCPRPCARALDELRADLRRAPSHAPEAARLAELGLGPRQLASLVRNGELLRVADGVVLLPGADDRAVEVLARLGPGVHPQRGPAGAGHHPPGRRPAAGAAGPHRPRRAHPGRRHRLV